MPLSLFLFLCLSVCVSLSLFVCLSVSLSLCLSVCVSFFLSLFLCLSVCISFSLSLSLSVCQCLFLSLSLSVSVSFSLSLFLCLSVCVSFSLSLSLSVCLALCAGMLSSMCMLPVHIFLLGHSGCASLGESKQPLSRATLSLLGLCVFENVCSYTHQNCNVYFFKLFAKLAWGFPYYSFVVQLYSAVGKKKEKHKILHNTNQVSNLC